MEEIEIHGQVEVEALTCSDSVDTAIERFQKNPTEHNRVRMILTIAEHAYDEMGLNVDIVGNDDANAEF